MSVPVDSTNVLYFSAILYRKDLYSQEDLVKLHQEILGENYELFTPNENPLVGYYSKEMGEADNLTRIFVIDKTPKERQLSVELKLKAIDLEQSHLEGESRTINWDIGYLALEQMVLLTAKPFTHRLHLSNNIYGDLTYVFTKGAYDFLPWTYPDYKASEKVEFFSKYRRLLLPKKG